MRVREAHTWDISRLWNLGRYPRGTNSIDCQSHKRYTPHVSTLSHTHAHSMQSNAYYARLPWAHSQPPRRHRSPLSTTNDSASEHAHIISPTNRQEDRISTAIATAAHLLSTGAARGAEPARALPLLLERRVQLASASVVAQHRLLRALCSSTAASLTTKASKMLTSSFQRKPMRV